MEFMCRLIELQVKHRFESVNTIIHTNIVNKSILKCGKMMGGKHFLHTANFYPTRVYFPKDYYTFAPRVSFFLIRQKFLVKTSAFKKEMVPEYDRGLIKHM